ncbi:MAG TPA: hypothetical protein V6D29_04425 [Leptolyngbyaceae cyanobacterium]
MAGRIWWQQPVYELMRIQMGYGLSVWFNQDLSDTEEAVALKAQFPEA